MTGVLPAGLAHSAVMQLTGPSRCAVVAFVAVIALSGCNSGEREPEAETTGDDTVELPDVSVTIPAERLTPFCQAMIDLNDELLDDPPEDTRARIIQVYESIVDVVPAEIADDFTTVLARLQAGDSAVTAPTAAPFATSVVPNSIDVSDTTNPLADEGYDPDADPTTRLAEYVRFACTDNANNPGPSATQPGAGVQTSSSD